VSGVKRRVMYFSKLLFKSYEKKFSLGGVKVGYSLTVQQSIEIWERFTFEHSNVRGGLLNV